MREVSDGHTSSFPCIVPWARRGGREPRASTSSSCDGASRLVLEAKLSPSRHVLVAVSFDDASVAAMQRGLFLARSFRVELRLLHVHGGRGRDGPTIKTVLSWAAAAGVIADAESVDVRSGDAALEIARVADVMRPRLVVLGGRTARDAPGHVARYVTCHSPVPVLVASGSSDVRRILAASDLCVLNHPVLRAADALALATSAHATALHNLGPSGANGFLARAKELQLLIEGLPGTDVALLTREHSAAAAIGMAAQMLNAEVVAVGVRSSAGATFQTLLGSCEQSILCVPISPRLRARTAEC